MEPDHALALLLRQADRRMTARLSGLLVPLGSSLEQWHVLSCLSDGTGRAMSEIGAIVRIPPPSMSKLVDGLIALNLVYRRVDPRDRRRVLVFLTARGARHHRALSQAVEQQEAQLRDLQGADEYEALTSQLLNLLSRLDEVESPAARAPAPT